VRWHHARDKEQALQWSHSDSTEIPLQAWQLVHQLQMYGFSISHNFSAGANLLEIMVGLPYTTLVEEATLAKLSMRLLQTKGVTNFREELIPRFPGFVYKVRDQGAGSDAADTVQPRRATKGLAGHGVAKKSPVVHESEAATDSIGDMGGGMAATCFSSAHRQNLCLHRMKRLARLVPESMLGDKAAKSRSFFLKSIKSRLGARSDIKSRDLYNLLYSAGAYRPSARALFGAGVTNIAKEVERNPWMIVRPPTASDVQASLISKSSISWKEVERTVAIVEAWCATTFGKQEHFYGDMVSFFPLHHKPTLLHLRHTWGTFEMVNLCHGFTLKAKLAETHVSVCFENPYRVC
jgi:hypothetical protein